MDGPTRTSWKRSTSRKRSALIVVVAALTVGLAAPSGGWSATAAADERLTRADAPGWYDPAPSAVDVRVGATGADAEVNTQRTIPIIRSDSDPGSGLRVVMRLKRSLGDLPSLRGDDKLKAMAELQVTTDCRLSSEPCVGQPYPYAPVIEARLLLSRDPDARRANGTSAVRLGEPKRLRCGHTEHHCVFVFRDMVEQIGDDAGQTHNPCAASANCFVNVVAHAWHPDADANQRHKLLIGENEPDGSVKGNKGSVGVVRIRPGSANAVAQRWQQLSPAGDSYPVTDNLSGDRHIVFRQAIGTPHQGQEFSYDFAMETRPTANFPIRISTNVIVANDPGSKKPVAEIYPGNGSVSRFNGKNCLNGGPCAKRHVGVFRARKDFGQRLWLIVLAKSSAPFNDAGNDRYRVNVPSGHLAVTRYV